MKKSVYITTTLPYINADPHVGFAMELIRADVLARYSKKNGHDVFFNTGTDEHGQKIAEAAKAQNIDTQEYCDKLSANFRKLIPVLNISSDVNFIRTTDEKHIIAAQEFWRRVYKNGFIQKRSYQAKYCVGCELEKTDSELKDGKCPLHPNRELEFINEENYFFLFSKFREKLLDLYKSDPQFVTSAGRLNEIKSFVENDLKDFSISRLKSKMAWGIPVPDDDEHVMYVWFDALVNYISTLDWPNESGNFEKFWVNGETYQYAGKDNLRQQSAMWQAMLMAANLPTTKKIRINGFINAEGGQKMSKSLGNVISPTEMVNKYGTDALRYFLLRHIPSFEDGDMSEKLLAEKYNSHLVNGLGNLVNRILNLSEKYLTDLTSLNAESSSDVNTGVTNFSVDEKFIEHMNSGDYSKALDFVWEKIGNLDEYLSREEPYKIVKKDLEKGKKMIAKAAADLSEINQYLDVFLPQTSEKIAKHISDNKKPVEPLFPRLDIKI